MKTVNDFARKRIANVRCQKSKCWSRRHVRQERVQETGIPNRVFLSCIQCNSMIYDGLVLGSRPDQIIQTHDYLLLRAIWREPW